MKRILPGLLASVLLFLGSASPVLADEQPIPKPGVLTDETVFTSKRLASYSTIVINDFDISAAETEHIDKDEQKGLEKIKPEMVNNLSAKLVEELKDKGKFKKIERNAKGAKNAVVVEGKFTMLNGGIGGVKFLLGFMAPKGSKTFVTVVGRLVDAETGKELAVFEESETGVRGASYTQNYADAFPKQSEAIGENIAEFIEKLY